MYNDYYQGPRLMWDRDQGEGGPALLERLQALQNDDWSARAFLSVRARGFHSAPPPVISTDRPLAAQALRIAEEYAEYMHAKAIADAQAAEGEGVIASALRTAAVQELADILIVCAQIGWHCGGTVRGYGVMHEAYTPAALHDAMQNLLRCIRKGGDLQILHGARRLSNACSAEGLHVWGCTAQDLTAVILEKLRADDLRGHLHEGGRG